MKKTVTKKAPSGAGSKKAYAAAGVDVDLGNRVKSGIQALVKGTHGPEVLGRIGGFGGLFRPNFRGMKDQTSMALTVHIVNQREMLIM